MSTKNQSLKCGQQVRTIPLERYRLPNDGRKWRQRARSRSALLLRLSSYANGDGSFVSNGRNYSPSLKTLLNHIGHGSFYELTNELRDVGLLSWTREKHYERRIYTIHLPETGPVFDQNQVRDSTENRSSVDEKTGPRFNGESPEQVRDSQNQVRDSQITGPTSSNHPSLPSLPSKEREPSADEKANPSPSHSIQSTTSGQDKNSDRKRVVEHVIERAKALSVGKACFSKKAKAELLEALRELGRTTTKELDDAIRARLDLCSDDVSYVIFGSNLASDLVGSVRNRRQRVAAADQERQAEKWFHEFQAQFNNPEIDGWLLAHPVPAQFVASLPTWLADLKKHHAETAEREARNAKPRPTAEELFGKTES